MTKQRQQDFALGLTAIVFLTLFVGTILFLYPMFQATGREVVIHFRHEDGMAPLQPGSAVILGGSLQVGRVVDVHVEEVPDVQQPGGHPRAVFVVRTEIDHNVPLYGNCQITTDQPAIGGSGFIAITDVGTPDVLLQQPIRGLPPQSLSAAIGTLSRRLLAEGGLVDDLSNAVDPNTEGSVMYKILASLDDLNAMTRELRVQLSPGDQQTLLSRLHRVLDDLNATTASVRQQMAVGDDAALLAKVHVALDRLSIALAEATAMLQEDRPLVLQTLTSVAHAAETVDQQILANLRGELDAANPTSLMGKLHTAMDRVNGSLSDVQAMTADGGRMVALSRPVLEKTLGNFQAMSEQLRLASQEVLLNPSKLIWGPSRQREEQLLVFQAARNFAEAASQLDDAAGRLEAVMKTLPADGQAGPTEKQELLAIHDAVRAAFQRFERAEQVLWDQLKE